MMYNPQLETFLCVVESGSFSKAAEKLYISAPAVIKQINSLESSPGLQLFDRSHRGLKVTPAGKHIKDFEIYNVEVFNRCENSNDILLAVKNWESVHPLIKMIPVEWNYGMPFGLLYSETPDKKIQKLLKAIEKIKDN